MTTNPLLTFLVFGRIHIPSSVKELLMHIATSPSTVIYTGVPLALALNSKAGSLSCGAG